MIQVSVVMCTFDDAACLASSIDSVLSQSGVTFELIVVNDGSHDPQTNRILNDYAGRDTRMRVLRQSNAGLTRALIAGCAAARGDSIARIDVGDVMLPDRLCRQQRILDSEVEAVLVTSWTDVCGPRWEHLYTSRCERPTQGQSVETRSSDACWSASALPEQMGANLLFGPSHHGSVMFRRAAYEAAGGYRWQFYYGQDWDLWYRLAPLGSFAVMAAPLYRCRIFPSGISMRNAARQRAIHAQSLAAFHARREGRDEDEYLRRAEAIRPGGTHPKRTSVHGTAEGNYFIGECLRRNGDSRGRRYLLRALRERPYSLRALIRLLQACALLRGAKG